jgi:hypothetical protein
LDPSARGITVLSVSPPERYAILKHDDEESAPGAYEVWRGQGASGPQKPGLVRRVDVAFSSDWESATVPAHLLPPAAVHRSDLLTLWALNTPSMWWTHGPQQPAEADDTLGGHVDCFLTELAQFPGFDESVYKVEDLWADTNWPWGYGHGVYCFASTSGDAHYVGRSLGATLGQRIWSQMQSQQDPEWKAVVEDPTTVVRVFAVGDEHVFMASALEAYLIERLKPKFNLRRQ